MEAITSLGPSAAAVIVVLLFLNFMRENQKGQERRDEKFSAALVDLTESNRLVASATQRAADEAAERNGHLAEIAADNQKATLKALSEMHQSVKGGKR